MLLIAAKTDQNGMVNLLLGSIRIFLKSRSENNENFEGQQLRPFLISTLPGSWAEKRIWVCLKMAYIPPKKCHLQGETDDELGDLGVPYRQNHDSTSYQAYSPRFLGRPPNSGWVMTQTVPLCMFIPLLILILYRVGIH